MRKCVSFKGRHLKIKSCSKGADMLGIKISDMFISMKMGLLCLEKVLTFKGH